MSDTVIKIENLYKEYQLGVIDSGYLIRDLQTWWARLRGKEDPNSLINTANKGIVKKSSILALNDINLEIKQGEVLGIIGRNGAGKSTLLKILSKVTAPSKGQVKIRGRVGSLLEVGTGFHPELTGRDNIFLNGAILGMKENEISKKLDEIVAFAEIEKFLDTPVKRYSSGMYVRLAFAVAAHLDTEILIVDEVLAVGDAEFQKKCLGKMGDVSKEGRTVLFVSHNMEAVKALCKNSYLIENGTSKSIGDSDSVIDLYLNSYLNDTILKLEWLNFEDAPGNDYVKFKRVEIIPKYNGNSKRITVATQISFICEIYNKKKNADLSFHFFLLAGDKHIIFQNDSISKRYNVGIIKAECFLPPNFLNDRVYLLDILIFENQKRLLNLEKIINRRLSFSVEDKTREIGWLGKYRGSIRPELKWNINFEEFK